MNSKSSTVYIVAGANGSGKTTFAMKYLPKFARCLNFINTDLIARGLSPLDVDRVSVRAGRMSLLRIREMVAKGHSFGFETTLSGRTYESLFKDLRRRGYRIRLYFLWIPDVPLALKRIADRVRAGGHNVPEPVVRRRFGKGLKNLFATYMPQSDYCVLLDNSGIPPVPICEWIRGKLVVKDAAKFGLVTCQVEKVNED